MNLNPRQYPLAKAMRELLNCNPEWCGGVLPTEEPSVWAMELPNEPYTALRAAFWWVSNEGRALLRLPGAGRA